MKRRYNGEGTICYEKKRKRYAVAIRMPDGRRVYRYRTDIDEAKAALKELQASINAGPAVGSDQTVGEYLNYWYNEVASRKLRPLTLQRYEDLIEIYLMEPLGGIRLTALAPEHIQTMLNKIEHKAPSTVRQVRAVLSSALSQAVKWQKIPHNPAKLVTVPRLVHKEPTFLTPRQSRRFLRCIAGHYQEGVFALGVGLGMRLGEILGLQWQDVDLRKGVLRVRRTMQELGSSRIEGEPKTARSRRTLPLPEFCVEILRRHRTDSCGLVKPDALVFCTKSGKPHSQTNVRRELHELLTAAGLPTIRFHDLRHTCASLLLSQDVPPRLVMEMLGHSQISTTMNTYTHVIPEAKRAVSSEMHQYLTRKRAFRIKKVVLKVVLKRKAGSGKPRNPN